MKTALLNDGRRFSFVQAIRFLRSAVRRAGGGNLDERGLARKIRVRPELSLNFPENDIAAITRSESEPEGYLVTATFLGLYGASSPLPSFYTEDLLDERREDRSITRDFLDIFHSPLYDLLFKVWGKHQLAYQIAEERDSRSLERLYCLLGLENDHFRRRLEDPGRMLRYICVASQLPKSAEGLRALLADALQVADIQVVPCVERMAAIPEAQRLWLGESGNTLGENSVLGEKVPDRMGKFRVLIGLADSDRLHAFLPDGRSFRMIREMIRFYLDQPLDWDLEIVLRPAEARGIVLGEDRWSRLGWNTWLIDGVPVDEALSVQLEALPE